MSSLEGSFLLAASWDSFGVSDGGKLTFSDVLVAVELSLRLRTPIEELMSVFSASSSVCVVF